MQRKISDIYFKIRKLDNYRIIIGRIKKKKNCTIFENLKRLFNWNSIFPKFFSYSKISQTLKFQEFSGIHSENFQNLKNSPSFRVTEERKSLYNLPTPRKNFQFKSLRRIPRWTKVGAREIRERGTINFPLENPAGRGGTNNSPRKVHDRWTKKKPSIRTLVRAVTDPFPLPPFPVSILR